MSGPMSEAEIVRRSQQIVRLGAVMFIVLGVGFALMWWDRPGWTRIFVLLWSLGAAITGIRMLRTPAGYANWYADAIRRRQR